MKKIKEWVSIQLAKNPGRIVLIGILLFNIIFFLLASLIISALAVHGTENMSFFEAAYRTVSMVLDAGCIEGVVGEVGTAGVALVIVCLLITLIGMITFTGAVIGYVTNWISNFIENANTGTRRLNLSGHTVILNWNTRASEIINDLLYSETKEKVVVLTPSRKDEIIKEIDERLSETTAKENAELKKHSKDMPFFKRLAYRRKNKIRHNVTFIVREGDVYSLKQLRDIQTQYAKAVVILGSDINTNVCKYDNIIRSEEFARGNSQTIKTLMQVSDITAAEDSADKQRIIVEITDMWTYDIVQKIIKSKENKQKCNIVPVFVNRILGQILSQFSLMPELNSVYRELFSNKGATFYAVESDVTDDDAYIKEYLKNHNHAIPLASLMEKSSDDTNARFFYYVADNHKNIEHTSPQLNSDYTVKLKDEYHIDKKNIIILGHNSDTEEIMKGFSSFACEWDYIDMTEEILRVTVVDDKEHLEKVDYYRQYPFVKETVVADIYDEDKICETINRVVSYTDGDTSVLILSDDAAINNNIDSNALANLIYVQDIIRQKQEKDPAFDPNSLDVVVEIIDPKHHDIVNSYNINNVVISNRYISKMITQIGEKEAIYNFYNDILTYDVDVKDGFVSKEIYIKKVSAFFDEIPAPCTADELIRAVYFASVSKDRPEELRIPNMMLGYVKADGEVVLFSAGQSQYEVTLEENDKIIVYSTH